MLMLELPSLVARAYRARSIVAPIGQIHHFFCCRIDKVVGWATATLHSLEKSSTLDKRRALARGDRVLASFNRTSLRSMLFV